MLEIGIQDLCFHGFALVLIQAASDKIGYIFHAAAPANILEVHGGNLPISGKTKIGQLGISVNKGFKRAGIQFLIDQGSSLFKLIITQGFKFMRTGFQVPIGALFP